jgi:hypothetical protein
MNEGDLPTSQKEQHEAKRKMGGKMKILATVSFGKKQVTAAWEFLNATPDPFLVITTDQHGNPFVIRLDNKLIKDQSGLEIAEKNYLATLNSADGFLLKGA